MRIAIEEVLGGAVTFESFEASKNPEPEKPEE
jgi:hypothetical protein